MPPPLPPSASYNLVLDTDSEGEEDLDVVGTIGSYESEKERLRREEIERQVRQRREEMKLKEDEIREKVRLERIKQLTRDPAGCARASLGKNAAAQPDAGVANNAAAAAAKSGGGSSSSMFLETLKRMRSASLSDYDLDGSTRSSSFVADTGPAGIGKVVVSPETIAAAEAAASALEKEEDARDAAAVVKAKSKKKKKKKKKKANKKRRKGSRTIPDDDDEDEDRIRGDKDGKENDDDNSNSSNQMDATMATAEETDDDVDDDDVETNCEMDHEEEKKSEDHDGDVAVVGCDAIRIRDGDEVLDRKMAAGSADVDTGSPALRIRGCEEVDSKLAANEKDCDDEAMPDADAEGADAAADDNSDAAADTGGASLSAAAKRRKKKKRKKKKKKSSDASPDVAADGAGAAGAYASELPSGSNKAEVAATATAPPRRSSSSVSFGAVSVREYRRAMGSSVVPADGGWPLGLSDEVVQEYTVCGDVDGFEERKQTELRRRYEEVMTSRLKREWRKRHEDHHHGHGHGHGHGHHSKGRKGKKGAHSHGYGHGHSSSDKAKQQHGDKPPPKELLDSIKVPEETLETRQFDYRRRKDISAKKGHHGSKDNDELPTVEDVDDGKNPLFGASLEDERKEKIVHDREAIHADGDDDDDASLLSHDSHSKKHMPSPPSQRRSARNRSRSHSNADKFCQTTHSTSEGGYDHVEITHVRNELEQIRSSRTGEGSLGCTCRKIHVFLPGHNEGKGKGHKRGSHRRMPERKVREELRKRGLLSGTHSSNAKKGRDELEKLLHDTVEAEPCCWGDDCPCHRDGIGCQADACSCWHPGHDATAHAKKHHHVTNADLNRALEDVGGVKNRCGNSNGMYVVDFGKIEMGRRRYLTKGRMMTGKEAKVEEGVMVCEAVAAVGDA